MSKVPEFEWLLKNKNFLNEEELQDLEELKLFEQHQEGKIKLGIISFLNLLAILEELYLKYSGKKLGDY